MARALRSLNRALCPWARRGGAGLGHCNMGESEGARSTRVCSQWNRWGSRNKDRCVVVGGGFLGAPLGAGLARIGLAQAGVQGRGSFVREERCGVTVEIGVFGHRNLER